MVTSLALLNLAGGECVEDLRLLEKDEGLGRVLRLAETHGMRRRKRRALLGRWRKRAAANVPSASAVFRFLDRFHDEGEESKRQPHTAFIPAATVGLRGLAQVNGELLDFVQSHTGQRQATLDMDATLIETHKEQALYCYKKYKAYQPLTTYWAEADLVVHSEFRDGNVPAGHQQLRVLKEALEQLPPGGGAGAGALKHGGLPAGVLASLRRGQRRTFWGDRVCRGRRHAPRVQGCGGWSR